MATWIEAARAKAGRFVTVEKIEQGGALQARVDRVGAVALYYRCKVDGQEARVRIGGYDPNCPPKALGLSKAGGLSLAGARAKAVGLAVQHDGNRDNGGLAAKLREKAAEKRRSKAVQDSLSEQTVEALFTAYVELLKQRGKVSAPEAASALGRFLKANAALASKPAHAAASKDFVIGLRRLHEAGFVREPGRVRSYAHAAFRIAMMAANDPKIPARFVDFGVASNPLATIPPTPARADKNPLSVEELRTFWAIAKAQEGAVGALMRVHLLTGGQRIRQLLRLQREDVRGDYIVLYDPKGRRTDARRHAVPLLDEARRALDLFTGTPEVFKIDGRAVRPETLLHLEVGAVGSKIPGFVPKRLRSGVETALASLGIGREARAQLQSHGLGGVQDRHYDDHDYMPEKRAALQALLDLLNTEPASNVTPIGGKAAA
jgi:integrase